MNEMLGNQYFMARNYMGAATAFQSVLEEEPNNLNAKKKLIISFTQIGRHKRAMKLFLNVIQENIDYILNTDPIKDDCPCGELVNGLEMVTKHSEQTFTSYQTLGILWLYCDINKSIEYFEKALELIPKDENINGALILLKKKLKKTQNQNFQSDLPS
jgi:tetratricopeptide (TPR) repeat protein